MNRPTECKWCGCSEIRRNSSDSIVFGCQTYWNEHNGGFWEQGAYSCTGKTGELYSRIKRAIKELNKAHRYRVSVERKGVVHWNVVEDGYVTDSVAVDEAISILEGERDEQQDSESEPV